MLSFIVRMTFEHEDRADIAEILRQLTPASRSEPGCVSYIPHFVEGEPCTVLIYEQYADEAAIEHHRATPHFHQFAVKGLYQKMRERQIEDLVAVC